MNEDLRKAIETLKESNELVKQGICPKCKSESLDHTLEEGTYLHVWCKNCDYDDNEL